MNRYTLTALSVTGGILSGLAWTSWCSGLILLVSFVPWFLIEEHIFRNQRRFRLNSCFVYILPGFVIFNMLTLGWVRAANIAAAITIILALSFLMSFIMWLAHIVRVKAGNVTGLIALISFWLAFEFLSLNSVFLSPWINLGNGLAKDIHFIQWYEVTGVGGGSLWILSSNLFLSLFLANYRIPNNKSRLFLITWITIIIVPSAISFARYHTIRDTGSGETEVVIVQPNIDPFTEKYTIPFENQLSKVLGMAGSAITGKTTWLLTPETTVDDPVNEDDTKNNQYIKSMREFSLHYPGINIVAGLVSFRLYPDTGEPPTSSARRIDSTGLYYDHFNSAFQIDTGEIVHIYHKSKLVAGIEMQFSAVFGKLVNSILPDMGGTKWGYGTQKERICFVHPVTKQSIAPIICYESVFGNYVADYVRKGASALFIITNDGWWKNTGGYNHHLSYASLRAIETRRPVARAANTGVSCIIDIRGKRIQETEWWTEAVLTGNIGSGTVITPYVRYGDYLMKIATVTSILILVYVFISLPYRKKLMIFAK